MAQPSIPQRSNEGWLQPLERPTLRWLAQRMPPWITPDRLTVIGFLGACIAAGGYALASRRSEFLWLVTVGLAVNWFGDSLDGNLARYRKIERPRYGFFLDQNLDALAQLVFTVGIGLSGFVRLDVALLTLAAYYLLTIYAQVRANIGDAHAIAAGGIGLTEIRVTYALLNVALYFYPPVRFDIAGLMLSYVDVMALLWTLGMLISFVLNVGARLRRLAVDEPPRG